MGNSLPEMVATPEILAIESNRVQDDFSFFQKDLEIYNDIWGANFYGMVGTLLNDTIFICGGILFGKHQQQSKATENCYGFSYDSYEWTLTNISMLHSRAFAQSVVALNGTFFVTGGMDGNGNVLDTTEHLDKGTTAFAYGPEMPAHISQHCALLINETHMIMTGGVQSRMRAIPNGNLYSYGIIISIR